MDDRNDVIVCPQCHSKEVVKGRMIRGEQEYGCLTCGFRNRNFSSIAKKAAKALPDKPKNFDESIFRMEEVISKDGTAPVNIMKVVEFVLLGMFIVFVIVILTMIFLFPNL